jgi:hypothetical protein
MYFAEAVMPAELYFKIQQVNFRFREWLILSVIARKAFACTVFFSVLTKQSFVNLEIASLL